MPPTHSVCFCNNRGGVGKTFMAFQTACEAARAKPDKKVLVLDFSLYSDITALLLGGSAREGFGAPMKGLQVTVEHTTPDTRAEGLIRDLEHAPDPPGTDTDPTSSRKGSIFGAFFARRDTSRAAPSSPVDLAAYAIRPADHNPSIPDNLYLIPSAGAVSWSETQDDDDAAMDADGPGSEKPLWTRGGDAWWPAARKLRAAVDALPEAYDAVFADTDHLAACVLTKLALATCHSVVVPLSFDDGDFNRLFQDVTGNALMTDVMLPMDAKGQLRARVAKMVFTRVSSVKNEPCVTGGGIDSPFKPSHTVMAQMDGMARQVWSACAHDARYEALFRDVDVAAAPGRAGNVVGAFTSAYFTAMKMAPDLAANISKMNGLPICVMTSEKYVAPSGLEGQSGKPVLDGLKAETRALVVAILDETYNAPIAPS